MTMMPSRTAGATLACFAVFSCLAAATDPREQLVHQCTPCRCHMASYPGFNETALIADCSRRGLTEVPLTLPRNINVLILSHNQHLSLKANPHYPYSNLTVLIMRNTNVRFLHAKAFEGLSNLRVLDLHSAGPGVALWSDTALEGLEKLEVLNVTVGHVLGKPFSSVNLSNLKELSVRFLSSICKDFLTGLHLETLYLASEKVTSLPGEFLQALLPSQLKALYICSKSLRTVPDDLFAGLLENLEVFHLYGSYIPSLPSTLFHMNASTVGAASIPSKLREILLCGVSRIAAGQFEGLSLLRRLHITQFHDLSDEAFSGLALLSELKLTHSTSFSHMSRYLLKELYELTYLKISHTQISKVSEESLEMNTELNYVDLSNNMIQDVDGYSFFLMSDLKTLDLSRNMIQKFESMVFEIDNLVFLDLSFNELKEIHKNAFEDLWKLADLRLRGNLLESLPRGIFENLHSIRWIDLSRNKLTDFTESHIEDCETLVHLDLSENCIRSFNTSALQDERPNLEVTTRPMFGEGSCAGAAGKHTADTETGEQESYNSSPVEDTMSHRTATSTRTPAIISTAATGLLNAKQAATSLLDEEHFLETTTKVIDAGNTPTTTPAIVGNKAEVYHPPYNIITENVSSKQGDRSNFNVSAIVNDTLHSNKWSEHKSGWLAGIVGTLAAAVIVLAVLYITVAILKRRRASYYRVTVVNEEAAKEQGRHSVGPDGEGCTIVRCGGPFDEEPPMERHRFV